MKVIFVAGLYTGYQCLNCPSVYPSIQAYLIKDMIKFLFALRSNKKIKWCLLSKVPSTLFDYTLP